MAIFLPNAAVVFLAITSNFDRFRLQMPNSGCRVQDPEIPESACLVRRIGIQMFAHELNDFGRIVVYAANDRFEEWRLLRSNGSNNEIGEARLSRGKGNRREELFQTLWQRFLAKVAAPDAQESIIRHFVIITVCGNPSESRCV